MIETVKITDIGRVRNQERHLKKNANNVSHTPPSAVPKCPSATGLAKEEPVSRGIQQEAKAMDIKAARSDLQLVLADLTCGHPMKHRQHGQRDCAERGKKRSWRRPKRSGSSRH